MTWLAATIGPPITATCNLKRCRTPCRVFILHHVDLQMGFSGVARFVKAQLNFVYGILSLLNIPSMNDDSLQVTYNGIAVLGVDSVFVVSSVQRVPSC